MEELVVDGVFTGDAEDISFVQRNNPNGEGIRKPWGYSSTGADMNT